MVTGTGCGESLPPAPEPLSAMIAAPSDRLSEFLGGLGIAHDGAAEIVGKDGVVLASSAQGRKQPLIDAASSRFRPAPHPKRSAVKKNAPVPIRLAAWQPSASAM